MNKTIIIGNPLANTYGMARSLKKQGREVILILEPSRFDTIKYSRYVDKIHKVEKLDDIIPTLLNNYGNEPNPPVLFCGSDTTISLIDNNYDLLKDRFVFFNAGKQGLINCYMNKCGTFPIAEKHGFSIIKTWVIKQKDSIPNDIVYPCLIKGNNSTKSTKQDMAICSNLDELKQSLKDGIEYLVQEYIQKEYELDIIGLSCNHGENVLIPAVVRKIRDELQRQSCYFRLDDIRDYPDLNVDKLKEFIHELKYEGIFSIEVLAYGGKYYFLEANLRNDGCAWVYTAAGINYPHLWALYGEKQLDTENMEQLKASTPLFLMSQDDIYNLIEGKVSFIQWLKDFHKAGASFNAYFKDPLYTLMDLSIHVKQGLKLVLRKCFSVNIH